MPNIKVDLISLFEGLVDKNYCVIKLPKEFPEYKLGSDLDIFCYDIDDIAKVIISNLAKDFNVKITKRAAQMYIDILDESNEIHFRFDLYGALPSYKNILINEAFFCSLIENSQIFEQDGCQVKVPCLIDETILRYIEYQEWYGRRPDKIKHISYIEDKIVDGQVNLTQFLDKLHFYTEIPLIQESRQISSSGFLRNLSYLLFIARSVLKALRQKGPVEVLKKIKSRLFK